MSTATATTFTLERTGTRPDLHAAIYRVTGNRVHGTIAVSPHETNGHWYADHKTVRIAYGTPQDRYMLHDWHEDPLTINGITIGGYSIVAVDRILAAAEVDTDGGFPDWWKILRIYRAGSRMEVPTATRDAACRVAATAVERFTRSSDCDDLVTAFSRDRAQSRAAAIGRARDEALTQARAWSARAEQLAAALHHHTQVAAVPGHTLPQPTPIPPIPEPSRGAYL